MGTTDAIEMSPPGRARVRVLRPGPLTTVQDLGRTGHAALGVPRSGALDPPAARFANRLVGNPEAAAVLETTFGGLTLAPAGDHRGRWAALTGAPATVRVDGRAVAYGEAFWWPGGELVVEPPASGVRSYLAVAGGFDVPAVLGSRSADLLSGLGPAPLRAGDLLPLGAPTGEPAAVDVPAVRPGTPLRLHPGPRADWVDGDAISRLCRSSWEVLPASNRVGLRLDGPPLPRAATRRGDELPSEGMVLGAVQLPPDGRPVVFLADHPTTGGYPVVAVVEEDDLWQCAQLRPGERVGFTRA